MDVLHTVQHPHTTVSILNWMLDMWKDSSPPLTIITVKHDGMRLDNRLRVRLSQIRKAMKAKVQDNYIQFGFDSQVISWTEETGEELEALCLYRKVTRRHRLIEGIIKFNLGG